MKKTTQDGVVASQTRDVGALRMARAPAFNCRSIYLNFQPRITSRDLRVVAICQPVARTDHDFRPSLRTNSAKTRTLSKSRTSFSIGYYIVLQRTDSNRHLCKTRHPSRVLIESAVWQSVLADRDLNSTSTAPSESACRIPFAKHHPAKALIRKPLATSMGSNFASTTVQQFR